MTQHRSAMIISPAQAQQLEEIAMALFGRSTASGGAVLRNALTDAVGKLTVQRLIENDKLEIHYHTVPDDKGKPEVRAFLSLCGTAKRRFVGPSGRIVAVTELRRRQREPEQTRTDQDANPARTLPADWNEKGEAPLKPPVDLLRMVPVKPEPVKRPTSVRKSRQFIDEKELARRLDISIYALRRIRYRGEGPPFMKIGRLIRYLEADVESWIYSLDLAGTRKYGGSGQRRGT